MFLESSPGDVLVFSEDLILGSFGGRATRRQLNLNFMGNPRRTTLLPERALQRGGGNASSGFLH